MRTREQEYAAKIYDQVKGIKIRIESAKNQVKEINDLLGADVGNAELKKRKNDAIKNVEKAEKFAEEYKTNAKNLAFLIRSAGLVQALYFTETRNEGSKKLIQHLTTVIENPVVTLTDAQLEALTKSFLGKVRNESIIKYMFLTEKCLLALKWYKRCVDIHLKDENKQNSNNQETENENDEA